jgi:hypothetical protein
VTSVVLAIATVCGSGVLASAVAAFLADRRGRRELLVSKLEECAIAFYRHRAFIGEHWIAAIAGAYDSSRAPSDEPRYGNLMTKKVPSLNMLRTLATLSFPVLNSYVDRLVSLALVGGARSGFLQRDPETATSRG